jgi:hypothetical protein
VQATLCLIVEYRLSILLADIQVILTPKQFMSMKQLTFLFALMMVCFSSFAFTDTAEVKKRITRVYDKKNNEIRIQSPILDDIQLLKYIQKGKAVYYLALTAYASTKTTGEKGVLIEFTDGTQWSRPEQKIDTDSFTEGQWQYSAFMTLTAADLEIFKTKKIISVVVGKYDADLLDEDLPDDFLVYVRAIMRMK